MSNISLKELIGPSSKQIEFFQSIDTHKFTLFGGAKGGGKSYIIRWALVRQLLKWAKEGKTNVRVGLFCEDYPSLKDRQITKINREFPRWLGTLSGSNIEGMSFVLKPEFGSGVIALRNLDDPSKYASSEFAAIAVDELTKNPRETFDQLRSILRWPGIEDTKFFGGTNPGGIGHVWVKKLFVDREFERGDPKPEDVNFVRSLPSDNPHLATSYLDELEQLPEILKKMYWYGDWNVFQGQYFSEWNPVKHVISPFIIPPVWRKYRSIDPSGFNGKTSCHWYAVDFDGNVFVYREYYATDKSAEDHAKEIVRLSGTEEYPYSVIDTAAFSKLGLAETQAEVYTRCGVSGLVPTNKERISGWDIMHSYLKWDKYTEPKIKWFNTCYNAIRTIPTLICDETNPEDLDTTGEDHAADETRYFLVTLRGQGTVRPLTGVEKKLQEIKDHEDNINYSYRRDYGKEKYRY